MPPKTVAELLNELFRDHRKPNGREYSNSEVSRALGKQLSADYISKIRRGDITNPGRNALLLLCQHFKVSPMHFFPEYSAFEVETSDISEQESSEVLAHQIAELSPEARSQLAKLLNLLRKK